MSESQTSKSQRLRPASDEVARADVRVLATRCPFCHDDVRIGVQGWVACERCLARHHRGCWRESEGCAACACESALEVERLSTSRVREPRRGARVVMPLLLLVLVGWGGFYVTLAEADRAGEAERHAQARATRREAVLAAGRQDAVGLKERLEQARADTVALEDRHASRALDDAALIEQLRGKLRQAGAELVGLRERAASQLLTAGHGATFDSELNLGLSAMRSGRYLVALAQFDAAAGARPTDGYVYACRGTARHALGDLAGALEDLNDALDLDPSLAAAIYHRGMVLFGLGDLSRAERDLKRAVDLMTHDSTWDFRVRAERILGQIARERMSEVWRARPDLR